MKRITIVSMVLSFFLMALAYTDAHAVAAQQQTQQKQEIQKQSQQAVQMTQQSINNLKAAIKNYETALKTSDDEHLRQAVESARTALESAEKSLEHARMFAPEAGTTRQQQPQRRGTAPSPSPERGMDMQR